MEVKLFWVSRYLIWFIEKALHKNTEILDQRRYKIYVMV